MLVAPSRGAWRIDRGGAGRDRLAWCRLPPSCAPFATGAAAAIAAAIAAAVTAPTAVTSPTAPTAPTAVIAANASAAVAVPVFATAHPCVVSVVVDVRSRVPCGGSVAAFQTARSPWLTRWLPNGPPAFATWCVEVMEGGNRGDSGGQGCGGWGGALGLRWVDAHKTENLPSDANASSLCCFLFYHLSLPPLSPPPSPLLGSVTLADPMCGTACGSGCGRARAPGWLAVVVTVAAVGRVLGWRVGA